VANDFSKQLQKQFDRLTRNLKKAEGNVPLTELMPPKFIQRHTRFNDLQAMVDAAPGAEEATTTEESAAFIQGEGWSRFVAENSDFDSWQDMIRQAGAERFKRAADGNL